MHEPAPFESGRYRAKPWRLAHRRPARPASAGPQRWTALLEQILELYGCEHYDGCGAVVRCLDRSAIHEAETDQACAAGALRRGWRAAFKVERNRDGLTLAAGHRRCRNHRK